MLVNLLSNVIKFMSIGYVVVCVFIGCNVSGVVEIVISIEDMGIGIDVV